MSATRLLGAAAILMILLVPVLVHGQVYVQQGNVMDANPMVNSGGFNTGVRPQGAGLGNRIVSGNVGGGAAFRGYSPIRDPSSLFFTNYAHAYGGTGMSGVSDFGLSTFYSQSGLPTDRLTSFNRGSLSIANARAGYIPGSLSRTPYYSSSSTVASTGAIIAGLNRPGSSQLISPYTAAGSDQRITSANPLESAGTGQGSLMSVSSRLVRIDNGRPLTGSLNERLLGSRLFGAVREVPVDTLADQARQGGGGALYAPPGGSGMRTLDDARREAARQAELQRAAVQPGADSPGGAASLVNPLGNTGPGSLVTSPRAGSLASTGDVYGLMRRQSSVLARSLTGGLEPPTGVGREADQGRAPAVGAPQAGPSDEDLFGPIRTFVGTQSTAINARLAEAEDLLKQGQYYRAAEIYASAQVADPANPLPHLGRSVSLLAAGDYMTSATALFTAIRLFDSLGRFQIDVTAFVPDAGVLENRRTDLEKRLQLFDDFRLRFLLGYLQFSTGLPDAGVANLEAAAKMAPAEFEAVGRFVADLKVKRAAKLAPATQPAGGA